MARDDVPRGYLPKLVPLVLYQGQGRWTKARKLSELHAWEGIPAPGPILVELEALVHEVRVADIPQLEAEPELTVFARTALVVISINREELSLADPRARLPHYLRELYATHGRDAVATILRYLWGTRSDDQELIEVMKAASEEIYTTGMSAGDRLMAKGEAKGKLEGKADTLLTLLELKFGSSAPIPRQRIRDASLDELDQWTARILTAETLDEIFADEG
ncbi:MAG: hypothetical protein AAGF11_45665 [Myxococcota bacterium]